MNTQTFIVFFSLGFSGCCWAGLGTGIYATVSINWVEYISSGSSGLWNICFENSCNPIGNTDWLLATRALLISMNALNLIGGILVIICQIKKKFKGMLAAGGVLGLAGVFGAIGAAVYTGFQEKEKVQEFVYDNGYYNAWISCGLLIVSSVFVYALYRQIRTSERCENLQKNVAIKL